MFSLAYPTWMLKAFTSVFHTSNKLACIISTCIRSLGRLYVCFLCAIVFITYYQRWLHVLLTLSHDACINLLVCHAGLDLQNMKICPFFLLLIYRLPKAHCYIVYVCVCDDDFFYKQIQQCWSILTILQTSGISTPALLFPSQLCLYRQPAKQWRVGIHTCQGQSTLRERPLKWNYFLYQEWSHAIASLKRVRY